jgi:hypothetical protein
VRPDATDALAEPTAIETNTGGAIVSVVVPLRLACVAVATQEPGDIAFATPFAAMLATLGLEELHVAVLVKSLVLPSL